LLDYKVMWPGQRIPFPVGLWSLWLGYIAISFLWLEEASLLEVQYALQLSMPILVGILASLFVRSREQLELLVRTYFFSLLFLLGVVGLCLAGVLSLDELDPVFAVVRPLSLTAVVIGGLFAAGSKRNFRRAWLGWAVCLAITVVTGSRMASMAMLALPILNPVTRHPLRKAAAIVVVGLVGVGVYMTPTFQERFFRDQSGDINQIASGDFDSGGRFDSWPVLLEEALEHPWLGHGVGSVQVFVPRVWPRMTHPHNDYLRVLFDLGSVGLLLFFGAVIRQLWVLRRQIRRTTGIVQQAFGGAWLGLAAFLLIATTDNPIIYHVGYMNPVFALMGAAYGVAQQEEIDSEVENHLPT